MKLFTLLALLTACLLNVGNAQTSIPDREGYVDLSDLAPSDVEPKMQMEMYGELLNQFIEASSDTTLANMAEIAKLDYISMKMYEGKVNGFADVRDEAIEFVDDLKSDGWMPLFNMSGEGRTLYIMYQQNEPGIVDGFYIVFVENSIDGDTFVHANVLGVFNLQNLGELVRELQNMEIEELLEMYDSEEDQRI